MTAYFINFTDPEKTAFGINAFTSNGTVAPTTLELHSTAVARNSSLLLFGKGHAEYGERIQENLLNIMENFSGATEPTTPVSGQTWFARITYVMIGAASPPYDYSSATFWRWDDETEVWIEITQSGSGGVDDPTVADTIKTVYPGSEPLTVVDGSFWLNVVESPAVPELMLGVNNSTSNLTPQFIRREYENLTGIITDPNADGYLPQKQLKVYDGLAWKNAGNVYTSAVEPQRPAQGDMWFSNGSPGAGLYVFDGSDWVAVSLGITSDLFVNTAGDTMTGALVMSGAQINMGTNRIINLGSPIAPHDAASKSYVDSLNTTDPQTAINTASIALLAGGSPYQAKVNRAGDTMTGALTINSTLTITPAGSHTFLFGGSPIAFQAGNHRLRGLADPVLAQDAVTLAYLNSALGSPIGSGDGHVTDLIWIGGAIKQLQLLSTGSPSTLFVTLDHTHTTPEIEHAITGSDLRDIIGASNALQSDINESVTTNVVQRLYALEHDVSREVFVVGSPQTVYTFTEADYVAGTNTLQVFINGVKQYANERAYQKIRFNSTYDISPSTDLNLSSGTYTLRIAVDGAAASVVSGTEADFNDVQDIIDQINLDLTTVTAAWDGKHAAIVVHSNTTGTGSEIQIVDGGSPNSTLLAALNVGSPRLYITGNIFPAANGPVSQITQDLSYREVSAASPSVDAVYGQVVNSIEFNTTSTPGDVIEMLATSR